MKTIVMVLNMIVIRWEMCKWVNVAENVQIGECANEQIGERFNVMAEQNQEQDADTVPVLEMDFVFSISREDEFYFI